MVPLLLYYFLILAGYNQQLIGRYRRQSHDSIRFSRKQLILAKSLKSTFFAKDLWCLAVISKVLQHDIYVKVLKWGYMCWDERSVTSLCKLEISKIFVIIFSALKGFIRFFKFSECVNSWNCYYWIGVNSWEMNGITWIDWICLHVTSAFRIKN